VSLNGIMSNALSALQTNTTALDVVSSNISNMNAPGYAQREARQWRQLNLGAKRIWLRYAARRVECARCGVVNEQVPWGSAAGWFSATFEETTA